MLRDLKTGELVELDLHRLGDDGHGRPVFQRVDGFEPLFCHECDGDGNWVATATMDDIELDPLEGVAVAAMGLFDSVDEVHSGVWQVPHVAMQRLISALNTAGYLSDSGPIGGEA